MTMKSYFNAYSHFRFSGSFQNRIPICGSAPKGRSAQFHCFILAIVPGWRSDGTSREEKKKTGKEKKKKCMHENPSKRKKGGRGSALSLNRGPLASPQPESQREAERKGRSVTAGNRSREIAIKATGSSEIVALIVTV